MDTKSYSDMLARRPRFRQDGRSLAVDRWFPRCGMLETERYSAFEQPVHATGLPEGLGRQQLRRSGFRPVTLFLKDGQYFQRVWSRGRSRSNPSLRPVVVWSCGGEVFRFAFHDAENGDSH